MNIEYYNKYLYYKNNGIKAKKKEYIDKFTNSFENYTEKELWTLEYLPKIEFEHNGNIRNELFEEIIFPVLWNGYNNKNVELMIWLTKLNQNCSQNTRIMKIMNYKSDVQIIKECYEIAPNNNEIIDLYLELEIRWISYAIHEWPSGILIGNNGATKNECKELLDGIPLLHRLDRNKKYFEFINDYEKKVKKYMGDLE